MKNKIVIALVFGLLTTLPLFQSCKKDTMPTPTPTIVDCSTISASYSNDIQNIMNTSCAVSGCHVAGFDKGDFSTYNGLKVYVDNGTVKNRAITQKNMPPSNSTGPTSLTSTQLELLTCWIEAGAPEN